MRSISLLVGAGILASCTTAPPPLPTRTVKAQDQYQRLLAGKVAQPPISCLPSYNSNDMQIIDEGTIAFRSAGGSRVWIAHMQGPCTNLSAGGPYALVTRQFGSSGLCHGDIAQVQDTLNHMTVGSCVFGDFTPYVTPGR
jgi:hypothetical protein